jgi:OOP family OmpA-OmpF porin
MFKKIAAAAALTLLASSSFAAPTAFYGGVDVGSTRADVLDLDSSKVSYGAFLGYGLNDNIAVELGYRRLGQWDNAFGAGNDATLNQTHLSVVASLPLKDKFSVFARVGYNKLNGAAETSSGALYGVGVGYDFNQRLFGRVEVQKPTNNVNNIGFSLGYKF